MEQMKRNIKLVEVIGGHGVGKSYFLAVSEKITVIKPVSLLRRWILSLGKLDSREPRKIITKKISQYTKKMEAFFLLL